MSSRKRRYFHSAGFRLGVMALLALVLQGVAIRAPLGDDLPRRILLAGSYLLLLAFVAFNLRRPGIIVIGAGLLLNFAAILANGGLMAITPDTLLKSGPLPADARLGEWLPGSKDILLSRGDVHLWFLTDRLVWRDISSAVPAFSIGDMVLLVGLLVTVVDVLAVAGRGATAGDERRNEARDRFEDARPDHQLPVDRV